MQGRALPAKQPEPKGSGTWNAPNPPHLSSYLCNCNLLKHSFSCFYNEYSFWSSCSLLRPSGRSVLCMVASAVLNFMHEQSNGIRLFMVLGKWY